MKSNGYVLATAAVTVGLVASACGGAATSTSTEAASSEPAAATAASSPATTATAAATPTTQLQSLIPAPVDTQNTKGPDPIADNGIHLHFAVNGAPADVVGAYKAALQGKGWTVTTIVSSSGGDNGGGGATYTGTHGDAYGVFDGGGYGNTTYINVCAWPAKPAEPNCSR